MFMSGLLNLGGPVICVGAPMSEEDVEGIYNDYFDDSDDYDESDETEF